MDPNTDNTDLASVVPIPRAPESVPEDLEKMPDLPLVFDSKLAPNGALIFDNSTLELLKCPRLAEYKWLRKRELMTNRAGRNFGSAIHIGLAERYRRVGNGLVTPEVAGCIDEAMRQFFEESPAPGEDFRNFNHATRVMGQYNMIYGPEPFRILKKANGEPLVEASFLLPFGATIYGYPLYYAGKIDCGIEDNDGVWSFDTKTAFQFGKQFDAEKLRDGGQLGYFWALWQILGVRPKGYIINAIRVRKPTRASEYSGAPIDGSDFKRMPYALPFDDAIESWRRDVIRLATMLVQFHQEGYFPEYRWNCVGKYGECDFFEACSARVSERLSILYHTTLFGHSDWSPLNPPKKYNE